MLPELFEHRVESRDLVVQRRQRFCPDTTRRRETCGRTRTLVMCCTSSFGVRTCASTRNDPKSAGAAKRLCVRYASAARKCRSSDRLRGQPFTSQLPRDDHTSRPTARMSASALLAARRQDACGSRSACGRLPGSPGNARWRPSTPACRPGASAPGRAW